MENKPWPYLYGKMDFRLEPIAKYLKGKTKGKILFDINCMHAPLLKYIDHDYLYYVGNDLQTVFPSEYPNCVFFTLSDERMCERLGEVDILIALGMGGYEISHEPSESKTMTQSIKDIISQKKPEIVILENITKFSSVAEEISESAKGYKKVLDVKLNGTPDFPHNDWVFKRHITILEKINSL